MPIQPKPYKLECPKCGYSRVVKPKSDALSPIDGVGICPKCNIYMKRAEMSVFDNFLSMLKL